MARLVLIDTSDQLPGLLPLHGWSALMASELVVVGSPAHPFVPHLDAAGLRHEPVPPDAGTVPQSRTDLLSGVSGDENAKASWVVDRVRDVGEVAYLFGPDDAEAFTRTLGLEAARAGVEVEVVYFGAVPKGVRLLELVGVQERLRAPDGCPWDREQTHDSLIRYAIEEVHELAEAIAGGDDDGLREELGDLLLQVVFHAQIAEDDGRFDIDAVAGAIAEKLVRRHPHVFGTETADDAGSVMQRWEELKAAEKSERGGGPFDGVMAAQPAVALTDKLLQRAASHGRGAGTPDEAVAAARAELDGLAQSLGGDDDDVDERVGDLLAAVVALARAVDIDAEQALRRSAQRFRAQVEAELGGQGSGDGQ